MVESSFLNFSSNIDVFFITSAFDWFILNTKLLSMESLFMIIYVSYFTVIIQWKFR